MPEPSRWAYIWAAGWVGTMTMFKWCFLWCVLSAQAAEVYSWRDADGVMHFGEKAPENVRDVTKKIIPDALPVNTNERDAVGDTKRLLRSFDEERADRQQQKNQQQAEQAKREQLCAQAQEKLQRYEITSGHFITEKDGSQRPLSAQEDQRYGEQLRELVALWCR